MTLTINGPLAYEKHKAVATKGLMTDTYWTASDGIATGYGDTKDKARREYRRITAWRRK